MVTILASLGSPISNEDVVNIVLEGLPDSYANVYGIIIHWEPFSDLKTVCSMLTTEEIRLKSRAQTKPFDSTSSSPMVLLHYDSTRDLYKSRSSPPFLRLFSSVRIRGTSILDIQEMKCYVMTVLSLAISRHWLVHQLDVKNAFLHEDLFETVYTHQPLGFWVLHILIRQGTDTAYLLLYVYDIVRNASSEVLLHRLNTALHQEDLVRAHMVGCKSSRTLVDTEFELDDGGDPVSNLTLYRSLAGSLQYLTFTRLDISYVVQQVFLYMRDPREPHFSALKRILRYVREAEYHDVANDVAETCWLRNLLREFYTPLSSPTPIYCDNVSAVYLSSNLVQHQRTKHIEIDIHFFRDFVADGQNCLLRMLVKEAVWDGLLQTAYDKEDLGFLILPNKETVLQEVH
ncbi:ribonuclease H-like domain-containing protein [Tanacetum coccineum]